MPSTGRRALLVAAATLVAACATPPHADTKEADTKTEVGDVPGGGSASNGPQLFVSRGCTACHTVRGVRGAVGVIGPDLSSVASVAGQRRPGMTSEDYLRESITEPDAYVVPGFQRGTMPKPSLNDQQVADLVAFLGTRK